MAGCKKCGKNLKKNEIRYCAECEDALKNKLLSLEKEIALEEKKKRDEKKAEEKQLKADRNSKSSSEDNAPVKEKDKSSSRGSSSKKGRPKKETSKKGAAPKRAARPENKKTDPRAGAPGSDNEAEQDSENEKPVFESKSSNDYKMVSSRMFAALIDLMIGLAGWWFCAKVFSVLGWLFISAYMLLKDVLFDQGSPGKVLTGLAVVRTGSREPLTLQVSMVRNSTLAAGFIVMGIGRLLMFDVPFIPDPFMTLGALLFTAGALLFTGGWCLELYWMNKDVRNYRFGDKIARTTVISDEYFHAVHENEEAQASDADSSYSDSEDDDL